MPITEAEKEEISADVKAFVGTKAFARTFDILEKNYVNILKQANIGELSATTAHASLHVLEDVKQQLRLMSKKEGF